MADPKGDVRKRAEKLVRDVLTGQSLSDAEVFCIADKIMAALPQGRGGPSDPLITWYDRAKGAEALLAELQKGAARFVAAWQAYTAEARRIAADEAKGIPRSYERMDILADQIDAACRALASAEQRG